MKQKIQKIILELEIISSRTANQDEANSIIHVNNNSNNSQLTNIHLCVLLRHCVFKVQKKKELKIYIKMSFSKKYYCRRHVDLWMFDGYKVWKMEWKIFYI